MRSTLRVQSNIWLMGKDKAFCQELLDDQLIKEPNLVNASIKLFIDVIRELYPGSDSQIIIDLLKSNLLEKDNILTGELLKQYVKTVTGNNEVKAPVPVVESKPSVPVELPQEKETVEPKNAPVVVEKIIIGQASDEGFEDFGETIKPSKPVPGDGFFNGIR